ncbi:MAG: sulfatase-like hydrolase/transferase [Verrucomicrobiae bacterium]|nr:sulfatase-like hydrolase/transferase [Verrucomicrobiae bacterium]
MNPIGSVGFPALALATVTVCNAVAASKPNILWLTSEDHGPQMGCYGDKLARTPNIDALAAKGMIFKLAWAVSPVCAPARTAIISGVYPSSSGGLHMRSMVPWPREMKLYPEFLREAGYYCTNNSKEDYNVTKPKVLWHESSPKAHWRNRAPGQPFFAIFNSTKSHESQICRRPHQAVTDPARVRVPAYHPDTPEVRQDWAQYYDKVSEADADAGRRLRELEEAGLGDDTIVFYYADHGSGMPRSKRWPSNSGLHVPLVVYFPKKWQHLAPKEYSPGAASERLVSFVDLAPTLLSIVGIRPPDWMQGYAFAGAYQTGPPQYLFGERGRMDERIDAVRCVTDGRYIYLRNFFPHVSQGQHVSYQFQTPTTRIWREWFDQSKTTEAQSLFWRVPKPPEELYDLQTDPDEVRNLADSPAHQPIKNRLQNVLRDHMRAVRDVCLVPEGELHTRAPGSPPYQWARDDSFYPLERILQMAELASSLKPDAVSELAKRLTDSDSAVRWWAVLGLLMRGENAVAPNEPLLRRMLTDTSPHVRIAAAEALGRHGSSESLEGALDTLKELASPDKNGVLVAMPALAAIEALGSRAGPILPSIRQLNSDGPSPDGRYNGYVPRLLEALDAKPAGQIPKKKKR